ncbi:MAG: UvrD-helicase domain-containing protein [Proteobacteria bacterium]|nr:UvrD-helicase domain-containing protein [Pseudomonadota bacterium]
MSVPIDWTELPLDDGGRSLVEASAGTGKTWTIGALYLRLLLEQKRTPRQIVVATFTNAAAAELSERLRERLLQALAEAARFVEDEGSMTAADMLMDRVWLRRRWHSNPGQRLADIQRLQAALGEFDGAPISTLHALCTRILADHPLAAGVSFRGRAIIDARTLATSLQDDLWRVIAQGRDDDALVLLARAAGITRADLKRYVPVLMQANVVVGVEGGIDLAAMLRGLDFLKDPAAWAQWVRGVATTHMKSNARLLRAWNALADALIASSHGAFDELLTYFDDLRNCAALPGIKKDGSQHLDVQALVRQTQEIMRSLPVLVIDLACCNPPLRSFLVAAQSWCRSVLQARLDAADQTTFDALLYSVRDALEPRDGQRALADALHKAWPVALIDEFQDTDPVQFGILDAIYRDAAGTPRGRLVMIGDPKQAIYRFRGGDVQAYEAARASVPAQDRLTLDTNFRSSRGYVAAINAFYARTGNMLGPSASTTTIEYEHVHASGRRDERPMCSATTGAPVEQPLVLHVLRQQPPDTDLETLALRACAGQIVQALSSEGYRIGDAALKPGDIAVLLPSHAQIARLSAMLKRRKVPCVAVSQQSVFGTGTARDLRLILHAALRADDAMALRAALVTRLYGCSLSDLQRLRDAPAEWEGHASRFHVLHGVLERRGPLALVAWLMEAQAARLLATVEGERILTDLRHLGELLQEAWLACGSGERLEAWFADQVDGSGDGDDDAVDARALRLESDADRVKLMTLHVSKGLEFPVVFLPLMWKHGRPVIASKNAQWLVDEQTGMKCIVLGPARDEVKLQEHEERYRMLYVALTRAIHACHVHVLANTVKRSDDAPLNAIVDPLLQDEEPAEPSWIARSEGWSIYPDAVWPAGEASHATRAARTLPPLPVGPLPQRHSFSTLVDSRHRHTNREDSAAADEALGDLGSPGSGPEALSDQHGHAALDALAGVAGPDFGDAVHAVFEHRIAGAPIDVLAVRGALSMHGVRPRDGDVTTFSEALANRLQAVIETPLDGHSGPRLGDLSSADMRAEMAFDYVLDAVSLRTLREACEAHGESGLVPDREQHLAGMMSGKIDLVFAHDGRFHVLDYKSNRLGHPERPCVEDYAPAAIETAMRASGYRLQALLYTVALEGYLRARLGVAYVRETHLGDCWYLFIRAVGLSLPDGTPCGVWRHRFSTGLLDAVESALAASTQQEAA